MSRECLRLPPSTEATIPTIASVRDAATSAVTYGLLMGVPMLRGAGTLWSHRVAGSGRSCIFHKRVPGIEQRKLSSHKNGESEEVSGGG